MHKFVETHSLPRLDHEEIENLNRLITCKEIKSVIKNLPTNKTSGPDGFIGEFYQSFKEELTSIFLKLFQKKEKGTLTTLFYKTSITLILKPEKDTTRKENHMSIFLINRHKESLTDY